MPPFSQTKLWGKSRCYWLTNAFLIMFPAVAPKCMRNPWSGEEEGSSGGTNTSAAPNKMEEPWAGLSERTLVAMLEQLFSHLLKILNICAHVLDDIPPGPAVKVHTVFCVVWFDWLIVEVIICKSDLSASDYKLHPQEGHCTELTFCTLLHTFRPPSPPWATPPPSVPSGERARRRMLLSPLLPLWAQRKAMRSTQVHAHLTMHQHRYR